MKFFAFIMAFLVLVLNVMPCADKENLMNEGKTKTELTKANQQSEQQQDDCSPFCSCTCCAAFSINHFIVSIAEIPHIPNNSTGNLLLSNIVNVALPIWQPPQLL